MLNLPKSPERSLEEGLTGENPSVEDILEVLCGPEIPVELDAHDQDEEDLSSGAPETDEGARETLREKYQRYQHIGTALLCVAGALLVPGMNSKQAKSVEAKADQASVKTPQFANNPSGKAKKLLYYKKQGKYNCDNPEDCTDLELMAKGKSISCNVNKCDTYQACHVDALDNRVLDLLDYLIRKGDSIGTMALCRSHSLTSGVHDDGLAVDISSVDGRSLKNPNSRDDTLRVLKEISKFEYYLAPRQIISGGVAFRHDYAFTPYNRASPGVNGAMAANSFGPGLMNEHRNHIHVGY
jgi:hypothetical protein